MKALPHHDLLVCPQTRIPLRECALGEAESSVFRGAKLTARPAWGSPPLGRTERVLVREDGGCAYPIVNGIPVLLVPEMLLPEGREHNVDLSDPRYQEAYEEMDFYNSVADGFTDRIEESEPAQILLPILRATDEQRASFPEPRSIWLDAVYDSESQYDVYRHLGPIRGKRILQLGGKGMHAVKFLLAGAAEAWALSPMVSELAFGIALAKHSGVADRFHVAAGVAEELPFRDGAFDALFSGGCVHHMVTETALPECSRVLRPGGRLGASEPWRAPFYGLGTRIFGKREVDVHCRPLTRRRASPLFQAFDEARIVHHGSLTRYPLLALHKMGLALGLPTVSRIIRWDDALCSLVPPLRELGSSVSLLGSRNPSDR